MLMILACWALRPKEPGRLMLMMLAPWALGFTCQRAWAADAHDARLLGFTCQGTKRLMLMMLACWARPVRLMLMMLTCWALRGKGLSLSG